MTRIYLASSYRNKETLIDLKRELNRRGHVVDLFCDRFSEPVPVTEDDDLTTMICKTEVIIRFKLNRDAIKWCDVLIAVLPAGNSTHMELGYAKGLQKTVIIYGNFEKGKYDAMYGFADRFYRETERLDMLNDLENLSRAEITRRLGQPERHIIDIM